MEARSIVRGVVAVAILTMLVVATLASGFYVLGTTVRASGSDMDSADTPFGPARGFIALPSAGTIRVQNVYSTSAQVRITFIDTSIPRGTPTPTPVGMVISDTLPAVSARIYAKPQNLTGAANILTDLQVQAVNFDLGEAGNEAYLGVNLDGLAMNQTSPTDLRSNSEMSPTFFAYEFPIGYVVKESEGWNARFSIQNVQESSAVLTISYFDQAGNFVHFTDAELDPQDTVSIDLADVGELPAGFEGSAVLTSDQAVRIAGSVQLYHADRDLRSAYRAILLEDEQFIVPALFKRADLQTSQLCIQNSGSAFTQINVAYSDGVNASQAIAPFATFCFDQGNEAHQDGWVGSAAITSSDDSVILSAVVVVDAVDQGETIGRWAYAVEKQDSADASNDLAFPLLYNDYHGWTSTIYLTNPNGQATTVTPHYEGQSGFVPCIQPFELAAGETRVLTQADLPDQFDLGSAYFASTLPVAAVVGATSGRPFGETDRHFGYSLAQLASPGSISADCEAAAEMYRPMDEQYWSYQRGYYMEIGAPAMWERGLTGSRGANPVTVAVIDTGVDLDHPDLVDNLVPGYDFVEDDMLPQDTSEDSHGTKVAGIIAARMNNDLVDGTARGIVGIAGGDAGANVPGIRVLPLRVAAESTEVECEVSARAIDYAVEQGARVINLSYGSTEQCADELAAIQRAYDAGAVIVAGAGNNNSAVSFFPAAYGNGTNNDLVLAVAGVEPGGAKALPSNYGEWIDFAAPYHQIRSLTKDGGYASDDGTSFAAPMVSGLLGILLSNSGLTREEAIERLRMTADDVDAANSEEYRGLLGAGRINANEASDNLLTRYFLPVILSEVE